MPAEEVDPPTPPRRRRRRRAPATDPEAPAAAPQEVDQPAELEPAEAGTTTPTPASTARLKRRRATPEVLPPPPPEAVGPEVPTQPLPTLEPERIYSLLWHSGILNVLAIGQREIVSLFVAPVGWVLGAILILSASLLGFDSAIYVGEATMSAVFATVVILMLLFVPIYTMRLVAQERESGTLEVLLTSPVRDWEVVAGKWLGGFAFYLINIAFTIVYLVLLFVFQPDHVTVRLVGLDLRVASLDYGQILSDYVGLLLAGAMFVAVGVLMSSLTRSQIIAAALSLAALLLLWNAGAAATFFRPPTSAAVDYLAGATHFNEFDKGAIALKDVVYFVTITLGALFLATRVLEGRRWA